MNSRYRAPELNFALDHIVHTAEQDAVDQLITPGTLDHRIDTLPREISGLALAQLNQSRTNTAPLGLS
jgi:hypothetical protein